MDQANKQALILQANEGRKYQMGSMQAVFKADEAETHAQYSISEWWMDPHAQGPGAHLHDENDEVFYVLEGTASILVGEEWISAGKGAFVRIPAGMLHDFENRTDHKMGLLNFYIPGGFERNMPAIVQWFEDHQNG
ncbi:cupin domain-containing protein [Reichenbachiella agarivorans]|uniref:Cupin domain-containing protein n=1 Tax=Reichenbachiella agarivorans TaxID=2979464 RepID=A0ABY6CRK8_9BACT|nr:cupin domain-containing protein [Reichenbachiella agarivorans]UXP32093.1 cupin domain-containing protein [Reichenbachiella agarivorans]